MLTYILKNQARKNITREITELCKIMPIKFAFENFISDIDDACEDEIIKKAIYSSKGALEILTTIRNLIGK